MNPTSQVVFELDGQKYGFDSEFVMSIENEMPVTLFPGAPPVILGCVEHRGELCPVCSLSKRFDRPEVRMGNGTLIFLKSHGIKIAFYVDKVVGIQNFDENHVNSVPTMLYSQQTSYIHAIVNSNGDLISLLMHDKLLNETEWTRLLRLIRKMKEEAEAEEADKLRKLEEKARQAKEAGEQIE